MTQSSDFRVNPMRTTNPETRTGPLGQHELLRMGNENDSSHQDAACRVLAQHFDELEFFLSCETDTESGISQLNAIWLEISLLLETEKKHLLDDSYNRLLNRITRLYTLGTKPKSNTAFAATATNYANVIEIVSQVHPRYDYTFAISHLLHYMNLLYKEREKSWLSIFQHLLSMSESVLSIQFLKDGHLKGIQRWVEEGVDNLFQLRDDQILLHSEKIAELAQIEQSIEKAEHQITRSRSSKIVPITNLQKWDSLQALVQKRDLLIQELDNRQELVDLLEQNIQEFETILFETKRACLIRPVQ